MISLLSACTVTVLRRKCSSEYARNHPVRHSRRPRIPLGSKLLPQKRVLHRRATHDAPKYIRLHDAPAKRTRPPPERVKPAHLRPPRAQAEVYEQRAHDAEHDAAVAWVSHERIRPARHEPALLAQGDLVGEERAQCLVACPPQGAASGCHQTPQHERCGQRRRMWRYWEVLMCFEESEGKFVVELVRVDLEEHTGDKLSEEARDHRPLEKGGADERDRDVNA